MVVSSIGRRMLLGGMVAAPCIGKAHAQQGWPDRPIRMINPWAPGGPSDLLARPINQRLTERLGKPVVMDNRPGANGTIATALALRSPPDGYTVLLAHAGPLTLAPNFQSNVTYDPLKDLVPVMQIASVPTVLVCRPELGAADLTSFITIAKAARQPLSYASVGQGSTTHLAAEMLSRLSGAPMLHVPYTGSTQAIIDMLAGRVDFAFFSIGAVTGHLEAGRLKGLAISTLNRMSRLPDIPAVAETYPGFEMNSWYGIALPAGAPRWLVERLHGECTVALAVPEYQQLVQESGMVIEATDPDAFGRKIADDLKRWGEFAKATGIRAG
ncbi:tripartite tricarboxylate transporter substrate binding protein [Pararoseomonas sp. SCSIO 73927]|uniref:Bug family tripartite tricarboxylate transporter substrate binding protein n=1 Tax=Pararoseomonas sp. SCSIO 73927 TaxID=3114537 RepID=UPI0030D055EF